MSEPQKQRPLKALARGPRHFGFATDLWTCSRVGEVIRRLFGVEYHVDYVGTLLHKLGWSVQKPTLRARERDEAAIQRWLLTAVQNGGAGRPNLMALCW